MVTVALVSSALGDEWHTLGRRDETSDNAHAEVLTTLIDAVLRDTDTSFHRIDAVGVGIGPGPFTGLRVGVVTAAALADAWKLPAFGVCSLDAVARRYARGEEP